MNLPEGFVLDSDGPLASSPFASAISSVESGGNYHAIGKPTRTGDRALGKYQVMGANVGPWTEEVLGRKLTPQEFLKSPEAQDAVFEAKFGGYVKKYGPEGAARAWFAGEGGMNDMGRKDVLGTTVAGYAKKFNAALPKGSAMGYAQGEQPTDFSAVLARAEPAQGGGNGLPAGYQLDDMPEGFEADPSFSERFAGEPADPPQKAGALRAGLAQAATKLTTGEPTVPAQRMAIDFQNLGSAAGQRTTPIMSAQAPNLLSTEVHQDEVGNLLYRDPATGQMVPTDQNKHVVLRDPADNVVKVFARTENTNEGRLASAGRLIGTGIAAGAPTVRASVGAARAPAVAGPGQEVVQAAGRLSATGGQVQIPKAVASDSMIAQQAGAVAANVPFAGTPMVRAAERTIEQLGTKADEVAGGFSGGSAGSSVPTAGEAARSGIKNWITGESAAKVGRLYDAVDDVVNPTVTTPLTKTEQAASQIYARRIQAGIAGESKAADLIAAAVSRPEGLTYGGIKDLRTSIGELVKKGVLPEGMSGAELNKIYGALSDDLRAAVANAGGERGIALFERANKYNRLIAERREALAKTIGMDGNAAPELVFDRLVSMAGASSRADVGKLAQARKAIGSEGWDDFVSGVVGRLGRDAEGAFSPQRFVTAYGKLSPQGKAILFRSTGRGDLAQHLDDIAKVSSRFKELQKFANPSGTGRSVSGSAIGAGAWFDPMTTAATVLSGRVVASMLARPATAASLARYSRTHEALVRQPSPARLAAFNLASRNLLTAAKDFGVNGTTDDFLRAIQGPMKVPAENE
jgi:hypothetical protein